MDQATQVGTIKIMDSWLELSDSAITIEEIVILTIMNTITIVDLLNISIYNTKIKHGILKYFELSQFYVAFYIIFVSKLANILYKFI